jgi:hypothetical protein
MKASWVGGPMRLVWSPDGDELARRRRAIMRWQTRAYDLPLLPPGPGVTWHGCRRRLDREMPGCAVPRQHRYVPAASAGPHHAARSHRPPWPGSSWPAPRTRHHRSRQAPHGCSPAASPAGRSSPAISGTGSKPSASAQRKHDQPRYSSSPPNSPQPSSPGCSGIHINVAVARGTVKTTALSHFRW